MGEASPLALTFFSMAFSGASYMLYEGDVTNGSGTATAWSLLWLVLFGGRNKVWSRVVSGSCAVMATMYGRMAYDCMVLGVGERDGEGWATE